MNFGIRYKDSPAAPSALYFSAQSLEAMNLQAEAKSVYQTIVSFTRPARITPSRRKSWA